jgi:probable F420-dependent oxidoreductase
MTVELSFPLPCFSAEAPASWGFVLDRARLLDRAGVDKLCVSDHVVFGERLEEYARPEIGGQAGGKQPTGPDGHWLEPMTLLSVVAGATEGIRLQTNILIAALRRPAVLAKAAATLDVLSNGRLELGVGVGWQREEYDAAGLDFDNRGALLDDTLAVCRTLWTQQRASYASPYLEFEAIHMMPKPTRPDGVAIWISGTLNARVVRRLAAFGSGWIPWGPSAADLVATIGQMRQALMDAGRDPNGLGVVGSVSAVRNDAGKLDIAASVEAIGAQFEAGVTDFRSRIALPADDGAAGDLLAELVPAFRAATTSSSA